MGAIEMESVRCVLPFISSKRWIMCMHNDESTYNFWRTIDIDDGLK